MAEDNEFLIDGWIDDPVAVSEVQVLQPVQSFADTPAGELSDEAIPEEVFGWKLYEKHFGKPWPSRNQLNVGSCVSFGTAAAIEYTLLSQIDKGTKEQWFDLVQEEIYSLSRVEIGKGRLGRSDGSLGAWAAQAVNQYGVMKRGIYLDGKFDLTSYVPARCREWGSTGLPDILEPIAKQRPVKSIVMVKDVGSAYKAIAQGYGIAVCSSRGFTMSRDRDGFANISGVWNHCMAILGYSKKSRKGFWICNSWGPDAHKGPVGPGNPPTCGFYADEEVVASMLARNDSWAFSNVSGFPVLDWSH